MAGSLEAFRFCHPPSVPFGLLSSVGRSARSGSGRPRVPREGPHLWGSPAAIDLGELPSMPPPGSRSRMALYIDADACPVKEEAYRVARRHAVKVFVVANTSIRVPQE